MRARAVAVIGLCVSICALTAVSADAQYRPYQPRGSDNRATGEHYNVEFGAYFWDPTPDMSIKSESLGIQGDQIDFVKDLGVEKARFKQMKLVLRPATKHKFRYEYTPITYTAVGTLRANIRFNGILYPVQFPVNTDFHWKAHRFTYEYDAVYRDRGFFGIILETKYTDVQTTLSNILDSEFVSAKAPIPSIGGIGRVYVAPNISITAELTGFPEGIVSKIDENSEGHYFDFDLYGTVNFSDHFGAQAGYRSFNVYYLVDSNDTGRFHLKGLYFGGAVRF